MTLQCSTCRSGRPSNARADYFIKIDNDLSRKAFPDVIDDGPEQRRTTGP